MSKEQRKKDLPNLLRIYDQIIKLDSILENSGLFWIELITQYNLNSNKVNHIDKVFEISEPSYTFFY